MSGIPKQKKDKWYKKAWVWVVVILIVLIVASVVWGAVSQSQNKYAEYDYLKQFVTVEQRDLERIISTTGTVVADETAVLLSPGLGEVSDVEVTIGDDVSNDDELLQVGSVVVRAPFDARVTDIATFEGDEVSPGSPLVELSFRSTHIEFLASESEVIALRAGQNATFSVPSYNDGREEFEGEVTFVDVKKRVQQTGSQTVETGYLVEVSASGLPDELERTIGLTVDLEIEVGRVDRATSIDIAAIQYDENNKPFVYVVPVINDAFVQRVEAADDITGVLETKEVTVGFRGDQYVEITNGLRVGDTALLYVPQSASTGSLF